MARIFVSHSSQDNAIAANIMAWLRENGFDQTFLDIDKETGIQPGMNWERTLYQQIDSSQAVILILTAELAGKQMVLRRIHPGAGARQGDLSGHRRAGGRTLRRAGHPAARSHQGPRGRP